LEEFSPHPFPIPQVISQIEQLKEQILAEILGVKTLQQLEDFRVKYLARKGKIAELFDGMRSLPPEQRPAVGKALNELRSLAQSKLDEEKALLEQSDKRVEAHLDLTLPGRQRWVGSKHPITQAWEEIRRVFFGMGFTVAVSPEIEDDYHNFEAVNFPPDHPARDMQDTFFITDKILLRTHTTPGQIRVMESQQPPIRVIIPGRCYRNEAVSARAFCVFHQVEGLYVDIGVTMAELKGTLVAFARQLYGSDVRARFRPSFFPFTEPSAEMDISCTICGGKGCRLCKFTGWLEILGAGMVDPSLYRNVGYDEEKYSGYAFGMGIERVAQLLYGVDDIRIYYENDVRFLEQF
jgi:phenylalanyl-tRNA synthetase alpha chain